MNALRKLVQSGTIDTGNAAASSSNQIVQNVHVQQRNLSSSTDQDYALHLQHLRKVFRECIPKSSGSNVNISQDDRLYSIIPIFVKLFRSVPVEQIEIQFPDVPLFGVAVGKLLVHEIRKRAGDRSSEGASLAIVEFLKPNEFSHGWLLLLSLQILSCSTTRLADLLCSAALPSTLVKIFYLFFDLPLSSNEHDTNIHLLATVSCEILCNLLRNAAAADELAKKDVMVLLFIASTSPCPVHNAIWRKCCQEGLCYMARHSLTDLALGYIHAKGCLKICVDNMRNVHQLEFEEIFSIFQYISVFLQEAFDRSQTMVDDFRIAQGFSFIVELGLRLEERQSTESGLMEQFVAILKEMCVRGPVELKFQASQGPIKLVSFQLPIPKGPPFSIRSLDVFRSVQDLFLRCQNGETTRCCLLAINELCVWDGSNYFLIDSTCNTLGILTSKIALQSFEVQSIYFNLLRHIVVELNHVPSKELSSLALVIRDSPTDCTFFKLALLSLKRIIFHDITFQDVYRDVGLLEVLTRRFVSADTAKDFPIDLLDVFQSVLKQNNQNCVLFRDSGGSQHLLKLVVVEEGSERASLLLVLQHLLTSMGCEDDIQHVLTRFNNIKNDLNIKRDLLLCLCGALRESHRARIAFRKSGAFVSLISAIVALEGKFQHFDPHVAAYLNTIFETVTTAMRYEPSNAKHFATEIRFQALADACRLLGCFQSTGVLSFLTVDMTDTVQAESSFPYFFHPSSSAPSSDSLDCVCFIFRCLYLMTLDGYRHGWADNFDSLLNDAPIVYTGAVLAILDLLPAIPLAQPKSIAVLVFVSEILKSLVRQERNQQLMCEAGMVQQLLTTCESALAEENHILNAFLQYILERLAAQSLRPRELRNLLRMRFFSTGHQLPLSRIKALVSMITLKDLQAMTPPAFVEFDLSYEGFGGLYLPSIAPQASPNFTLHTSLASTDSAGGVGGIGNGVRIFPPASPGLSVVIWFCIDYFTPVESIRLLDITRHLSKPQDSTTCLSIHLVENGQQLNLLVTTREHSPAENPESDTNEGDVVLVDVNFLRNQECIWHCLTVSLGKSLVKSGYCHLYVDDRNLGQFKLASIPQNPGGGAATLATASSISATIGTQPLQRKPCRLRWKLATVFLLEDVLSYSQTQMIYSLGPGYHGTFQDSQSSSMNIVEDKVLFGFNPVMATEMSVAKIRRIYNKDDAKAIAKHLALSSHDSSTPVKIIHNSAAHLRGTSRGIGAAVVGYLGVRVFAPKPAHQALLPIGGIWSLLGMVAMAPDTEYLYASMKCLFCALKTSTFLREQMSTTGGFQFVAMMLKKKKDFLNSHVLHLAFSMVTLPEAPKEIGQTYEKRPLEDLLVDIQLWLVCSTDLQRSLFEHFLEFSKDSNSNAKVLCECFLIKKTFQFILITVSNDCLETGVLAAAGDLLWHLLCSSGKSNSDILSFGQYLICTIPSSLESQQGSTVALRNLGLKIMRSLCDTYGDLMSTFLGFDWILSFFHPALHPTSLYQLFELFCHLLLSNPANMLEFREAKNVGKWLRDSTFSRKRAEALRLIPSHQSSLQANLEIVSVSGFFALQALMPDLSDIPISWLTMLSIFLGKKAHLKIEPEQPLTLDLVWQNVFNAVPGTTIKFRDTIFCSEAILVIFNMIRKAVEAGEGGNATCILQVVIYMYHNWNEFGQLALTGDFIGALVTCLFTFSEEEPEFITQTSSTRRLVLDLLRMIISDSLALPAEKFAQLMDSWLETYPDKALPQSYQVEISEMMMDHFTALTLITNTSAMWIHPSGNRTNVAGNLFNFAQKLVEKIWKKQLGKLDKSLVTFLVHNLECSLKTHDSNLTPATEVGFSALNRLIIYQITRASDSVSSQMSILDGLHTIVDHRAVVFHPLNSDVTFLISLAYCLSMIVDRVPISCDLSTQSSWHTYPEMSSQILEGWQLLQTAACSVWNVLLQTKKRELWEYLRPPRAVLESDLPEVKEFIRESSSRAWTSFLEECSRRHLASVPSSARVVNMAAVKKLPHSLVRAYSRQKSTKQVIPAIKVSAAQFLHQLRLHCLLVKQYVLDQLAHVQRSMSSLHRLVEDEWLDCENEFLLRERSLFGPEEPNRLEKWMLDMTEGPQRVRKKLVKNSDFYIHYPYRDVTPSLSGNDARQRIIRFPVSADSKLYEDEREGNVKTLLRTSKGVSITAANVNSLSAQAGDSCASSESEPKELDVDEEGETNKEDEGDGEESDDTVIRRLIEEGDTITYAFRCARVEGLDAYEGLMLLGKEHFYLIDGYTLLSTREIRDIESIPPSQREPVLPSVILGKRKRQKFHYEEIREVLRRRYLLQPIGIEIFCTNGRTNLLAFPRDISNRVYSRLLAVSPNITDSAMQSVAGQKRSAQLEPNSGLLNSLMGEKSVTERWLRGEISNFQYLMFLNTLAGRSYNDLMQYPIFPWILADYDSPVLDLSSSSTFRDLSKVPDSCQFSRVLRALFCLQPMGAQTDERLQQYLKRFREWDPNTKDSPFIYGTHYSTAMIVASYLLRLEPFTQHFLHLQGGHFDLADRMFHSVKDAWLSASTNNMADVKELIPEFFYLPDFLINSNKFDLGTKQSGVMLNDIVLPPWAKGDAREFIRIHREALESDYVSSHLHEFIDLVWGCKQRGQAAIEANNLFHNWMYEGVELDKLSDPLEKQAFIAFINNFGQVPLQIFKKPHPIKKVTGQKSDCLYHHLSRIHPILTGKELRSPVGCIIPLERGCLPLEQNKNPIPPHFTRYLAWGFPDHSLRACSLESDRPNAVFEIRDEEEVLCAVCPTSDMFLVAGMSGMISVYTFSASKRLNLTKHLYGHYEPVTCLVASSAYSLALSGSKDRSCIVWDLDNLTFLRSLKGHSVTVSAVGINDLTGDMGTCAGTMLFYWDINGRLLATVDTFQGQSLPNDQILCITFSQLQEWDNMNVVVIGGTDGCIRFFSDQLVQTDQPDECSLHISTQEGDPTYSGESDPVVALRRLSIHGSVSATTMYTRSAPAGLTTQEADDTPSPIKEVVKLEDIQSGQSQITQPYWPKTPPLININPAKQSYWHRRLILRTQIDVQKSLLKKTTTGTNNKGQLSITALCFSRDHKALYVGDSLGRVSTWLSSNDRSSKP